jgi:FkbM family methyltransferase
MKIPFDEIEFLQNNRIKIKGFEKLWNNRLLWHSGTPVDFIKEACNNNVKNIIEFGSYDGGDGIRYRCIFPNANVYSIEASPSCYEKIKPLEKYGLKIFNYAISNKNCKAFFYETYDEKNNNYAPCGSLDKNHCSITQPQPPLLKILPQIEVSCLTLETFCDQQKIKNIDLLHVDVEGHAVEVVEGFGSMRPKLIYIEVKSNTHNHSDKIFEILTKMHYNKVNSIGNDEIWVLK